ncbi:transmembrane emp24 domain-containing protein [Trifolium pratense]|uniref:Transmembrane emp24 domain-containing protein n=1 Tax=Trifolium pratense TaxID=57577 RepID=A0A2K3PQQ3_TRIPR|nr:transmembrane emp24 domain-containing protein [Trifolium pratense]
MFNSILLLIAIVPALFFSFVNSMRFELKSGEPKCITEDIMSNAMTVGNYSVVNPNEGSPIPDSHKITVRVRSPYGNNYHFGEHVTSGNFAYTTSVEAGDHTVCFSVLDHEPSITVNIDFEWRTGISAKDWYKIAKKDHIEVMESEIHRLYQIVTYIHDEMYYLREREAEMQELNIATDNKMFIFIFLSIIVCLSVAGSQLCLFLTGFGFPHSLQSLGFEEIHTAEDPLWSTGSSILKLVLCTLKHLTILPS